MKKIIAFISALGFLGLQVATVSAATISTNTSTSGMPSSISSSIKEEKSETTSTETTERTEMKSGKSVTATAPQTTGVMTVKTKHLNLRASAGMKAKIVQKLNKGDQVNVQSWSGQWANVNFNGVQGFVWGAYLK